MLMKEGPKGRKYASNQCSFNSSKLTNFPVFFGFLKYQNCLLASTIFGEFFGVSVMKKIHKISRNVSYFQLFNSDWLMHLPFFRPFGPSAMRRECPV